MKIETVLSVMRVGENVHIHCDRFRGEEMLTSKTLAKLSIEEADVLVAELSKAIHQESR